MHCWEKNLIVYSEDAQMLLSGAVRLFPKTNFSPIFVNFNKKHVTNAVLYIFSKHFVCGVDC